MYLLPLVDILQNTEINNMLNNWTEITLAQKTCAVRLYICVQMLQMFCTCQCEKGRNKLQQTFNPLRPDASQA